MRFSLPAQTPVAAPRQGGDAPNPIEADERERDCGGLTEFLDAGLVLDDRLSFGEALTALFEVVQEGLARLGLAAGCSAWGLELGVSFGRVSGSGSSGRAGGRCKMPREKKKQKARTDPPGSARLADRVQQGHQVSTRPTLQRVVCSH